MITNETQLQQAAEQMGRMVRALAALHAEELRRLEQTIRAYIDQTLDGTDDSAPASASPVAA